MSKGSNGAPLNGRLGLPLEVSGLRLGPEQRSLDAYESGSLTSLDTGRGPAHGIGRWVLLEGPQ